jgi:hypothetical protein
MVCPLVTLAGALSLWGQSPAICLRDQVNLGAAAVAAFRQEIPASLETPRCDIQIAIHWEAPSRFPTALGLTRVAQGRPLPQIELYLNPILRLLDTRTPALVGRALARVAAHELVHYVSRRTDHDAAGLFQASYRPAHLR